MGDDNWKNRGDWGSSSGKTPKARSGSGDRTTRLVAWSLLAAGVSFVLTPVAYIVVQHVTS